MYIEGPEHFEQDLPLPPRKITNKERFARLAGAAAIFSSAFPPEPLNLAVDNTILTKNSISITHDPIDIFDSASVVFPSSDPEYKIIPIPIEEELPQYNASNLGDIDGYWYLDEIRSRDVQNSGELGKNSPTIAVIDSGFNPSNTGMKTLQGYNVVSDTIDTRDEDGHGTMVTHTLLKTNRYAQVMPIKVFTSKSGTLIDLVEGIKYAADNNVKVISISMGALNPTPSEKNAICQTIDYAQQKGIIIVAAAGNNGTTQEIYPADCNSKPSLINTGGLNKDGTPDENANYGKNVDIASYSRYIQTINNKGELVLAGGTSLSAPQVAASIAAILDKNPYATPEEVAYLHVNFADKQPVETDPQRAKPKLRMDQSFWQTKAKKLFQYFFPQIATK